MHCSVYSQLVGLGADVVKDVGHAHLVLVSDRRHPGVVLPTEYLPRTHQVQVSWRKILVKFSVRNTLLRKLDYFRLKVNPFMPTNVKTASSRILCNQHPFFYVFGGFT